MNNAETFIEFIREAKAQEESKIRKPLDSLNIDWVLWMLEQMKDGGIVNPEWLRASKCKWVCHPLMQKDQEPPMFLVD